ncbi:hypothetical protein [Nocardioides pantholopis]|uniref:hypothetical protein n=1 Tax=Nocardioides pantholopis TaxID=2483798 RepID=UPI000FD7134A|nr:hypothetical protein [Nocardioides pantholopis]
MTMRERGTIVGEPGPVPMSSATAHHEAGHAIACEHFGLSWVIHGPSDDDNFMSRTELHNVGTTAPGFDLESVAFIAMAGWAAESRFVGSWKDPYVREGAAHDFVMLENLAEERRELITEQAKSLVASEWHRVQEIAAEVLAKFG